MFERAFKPLKRNKAVGDDDINFTTVLIVYDEIKACIQEHAIFKIANVTPVFKNGNSTFYLRSQKYSKKLTIALNHCTINNLLFLKEFVFPANH